MITKDNLQEVLKCFEFTERKNVWTKQYSTGASITVDFISKKIIYAPFDENFSNGEYPSKDKPATGFVIHRDTTINFSSKENFVCLVCVHLLLKKGYEAKHIVIEPAFKVAHGIKPSYGDILVFDKEYDPLVLIENKTYGTEFSKEWNLMQKNGGQLFGYLGEIVKTMKICQSLVLFAADFEEKRIVPQSYIITLKDNEKRIAELDNPITFTNAQGRYFEVWNQTYRNAIETKGLFEDDVEAYTVGKSKYSVKNDLNPLSHAEIRPIYNEFATILRNHAITDFEHSFYTLIDLFLCKITDERNHPDDLQFYYKGITRDTPKDYCARLLKLYQDGKKQIFDIDVVNKDESDIVQIFEDTCRILTNGLFAGIKALFEEIKFYNIKKFNFIEVENKENFEMNFQILIKITALIQNINLSNSETNHFFGDLFEGLLSRNVHQTEGQFFTPLPIVNFIIKSLPQLPNSDNVKILDYACGAGHFLTEIIKSYPNVKAYGIEKSQPLSQVAKIATIINGAKESHIVFKDSLSSINTKEIRYQGFEKESFDCIIANPPYSVSGFLKTLTENDRNQFYLSRFVDEKTLETNRSIECFFVERAHYFLKKNGLMSIILPASILTSSNLSKMVRELLFAHFNILAIVFQSSRTFGSTGKDTIILFAQKVNKNSEGLLHAFLEKNDCSQYVNNEAIDLYIQMQGYNKDEYYAFMQNEVLSDTLEQHKIFAEYRKKCKPKSISKSIQNEWFKTSEQFSSELKENSKEYKKLFSEYLATEEYKMQEDAEYRKQFILFAKEIESDNLNTFIQIENNHVAILQSPPEKIGNKSNKANVIKFLGYDWSSRRGYEGISYLTNHILSDPDELDDEKDAEVINAINSIKYIETPLYNPNDDYDNTKFAFAIRRHIISQCNNRFSFKSEEKTEDKLNNEFSNEMSDLLTFVRLTDLVKFSKADFDKTISLENQSEYGNNTVKSKYPLISIDNILKKVNGNKTKIKKSEIHEQGEYPVITQESGNLISGYTDNKKCITDLPLIIFGDHSCTFKYVDFPFVRGADGTQLLKTDQNVILTKYLYYYLSSIQIHNAEKYERHYKYLKTVQIPIPESLEIQNNIVADCASVEREYETSRGMTIETYRDKIEEIFVRYEVILKVSVDSYEISSHASKDILGEQSNDANTIELNTFENKFLETGNELLIAAEPFERYRWEGFDQSINDFFGSNQTILIGCFKGKEYQDWIHSHNIYNIRLGKTKGSMEENRELFDSTSLLILYELGKSDKLSAYKITGHHEISKDELLKLGYPNKKPRKSYMAFDIVPLEKDLTFLVEHHLIERLIEIDSNNAKGTPIFIEP